jgi:hypothetical protein
MDFLSNCIASVPNTATRFDAWKLMYASNTKLYIKADDERSVEAYDSGDIGANSSKICFPRHHH